MGWAYYPRVGIPSIRSARGSGVHAFHAAEQDANRRAFLYINKNVAGFQDDTDWTNRDCRDNRGWDFYRNPLNIDGSNTRMQYVDFQDQDMVNSLSFLRLRSRWYDYASWFLLPAWGPVWVGLFN